MVVGEEVGLEEHLKMSVGAHDERVQHAISGAGGEGGDGGGGGDGDVDVDGDGGVLAPWNGVPALP